MNGFEILALVVWLFPIFVLCCIIYGYLCNRFFWHQNPNPTSKIIIQITTLDNYDIVNRNIATIRSYDHKICPDKVKLLHIFKSRENNRTILATIMISQFSRGP